MATTPPSNVHISKHPCLRAKLSQLRSKSTSSKDTKQLVHEIALIVGCEALGSSLAISTSGTDLSPLGYEFTTEEITPQRISIVPILRSGLGMVEAVQTLLPAPVPVHHLGLFRERTTLQPVEYYNNLPYHLNPTGTPRENASAAELVILVDPIIATGATAVAAIQTLKEWGVKRVVVIAVLCNADGVTKAAQEWPEGVEVWAGGLDQECDARGMIKPGVGDIGDRLFLTIGK